VRSFDGKQCRDEQKQAMKKKMQLPAGQQGSGKDMTPKKVEARWANGRNDTQMIAWVLGNDRLLQISPGGVKIGGLSNPKAGPIEKPFGADAAFAQAEFFYDCAGAWRGDDCNGRGNDQEEAMWHFRWRARLRRYNRPYDDLVGKLERALLVTPQLSFQTRAGAASLRTMSPRNALIHKELDQVLLTTDPKTFAVH
jgi:hypothetical protein